MDVSPYLSAIQSLNGDTPGEKYKDLHSIAAKIIDSDAERETFVKTGQTDLVPSALQPNVRILVALKLKSKDAVVEALKSDDVTIIKLALGAKWFFNASNDLMNQQYFTEKLLPFVSLRTRLELIKTLSKCLQAQQAESFHREFVVQFGSDQALPLLAACGEDYVYDAILKNKILLSERMLKDLYRKYPQLVIRYLRLINDNTSRKWNKSCSCDSDVDLTYYINFLPRLVKNHTPAFVEFVLGIADRHRTIQLGSTRAEYFLRNAADALVKDPEVFLDWLPLKLVKSKLSKQQYDAMLMNLFPDDVDKLCTSTIVNAIHTYYPKEGGFELYRAHYKKAYGSDLLQHKDLFENECIYQVLPTEIRAECSRTYVNSLTDKAKYLTKVYQLPPSEAIPLLKEQISKSSLLQREASLRHMLQSCNLHKSKADLLQVLQYYNARHKNEQAPVLLQFLEALARSFDDMESLDKEHWKVIKEIVQRAYVKGDLTNLNWYFNAKSLFDPMLRYFLKQSITDEAEEADKAFLDKIINIILEYYCEHNKKWDFITDAPELEEACLEKFLAAVPQKYPENHAVWKKDKNKLSLTSYFVDKLGKFNDRNLRAPLNPKVKVTKMLIQYYPWLAKFATELFIDKEDTSRAHSAFKRTLRKCCPEFYQNVIDEHSDLINDVTTNDALTVLRRDRSKISSKINEYVTECRNQLAKGGKCTKHFVMSLKWYQGIPLKFVDKCLAEIEEKGSILILGILLEGATLSKIIEPYLPKESKLETDSENAKRDYELVSLLPRALNYANPPPPLEALISLCKGDYLSVALQTLSSIAQRVPIDRVLSFANHLASNAIAVKKAGIRLVFQVSPKPQVREFLSRIYKEEKNPGIREVVAKMVYEVFTQTPSQDSWQLMKEFIHGILPDDKDVVCDVLKKLKAVHVDYATDYLLEFFKKINSFNDEQLDKEDRSNLIVSFLNEIDDSQIFNKLPENIITDIITNYLFSCTLELIFNIYLFSDEQKFEGRLKVFMGILSENLNQINTPDPKQPRSYPTLKKIRDILGISTLFNSLMDNENKEMNRRLISSVLENTLIRKELECCVNFNIYQVYFDSSDAKSFGENCGKNIDDLVKVYNSEWIVENYGKCLVSIITKAFNNQVFDVIDGMINYKFSYGVFVGLKLLQAWKVPDYDDRYDKFVETVQNSGDLMAQALLNNFLKGINYYD